MMWDFWSKAPEAVRFDARGEQDDFTQADNLYRLMLPDAKDRLTSNIAGTIASTAEDAKQRQMAAS